MITSIKFSGLTERSKEIVLMTLAVSLLTLFLARPVVFLIMLLWGVIDNAL